MQSPKAEHHVGGKSRVVPLFPELRPYLKEVWDQAEPGTQYVITRYRDTNSNLRTQLMRIIGRASLKPWPKLFQNLRSTRQTELEETFPSHIVCAWIGNSQRVAEKHYLQVTDEHYAKAVQNPVQQPAVLPRTDPQAKTSDEEKTLILRDPAAFCDYLPPQQVGAPRFELGTSSLSATRSNQLSYAPGLSLFGTATGR